MIDAIDVFRSDKAYGNIRYIYIYMYIRKGLYHEQHTPGQMKRFKFNKRISIPITGVILPL